MSHKSYSTASSASKRKNAEQYSSYQRLPTTEFNGKAASTEAPWQTNPWHLRNIAIPASYFCVGMGMSFISTPLTYYCVNVLDASAAQQNIVSTVMSLPWSFKLVYGFLSDTYPIMGMRRKPYFVMGWGAYVACNLWLALLGEPDIRWITLMCFLQTVGYMCADVMTDTMVVERSKEHESAEDRGSFQATGYTVRTFGTVIGSILGATLYNHETWGWGLTISQVFTLNAAIPAICLMPLAPSLLEINSGSPPKPLREQWREIFAVLQKRAVWQPCSFVFLYNVCQVSNAAWSNFLILGLGFTDWNLGILTIFSAVFSWFGIVVYKRYFFNSSWRFASVLLLPFRIYIYLAVLGIATFMPLHDRDSVPLSLPSVSSPCVIHQVYLHRDHVPERLLLLAAAHAYLGPQRGHGNPQPCIRHGGLGHLVLCALHSIPAHVHHVRDFPPLPSTFHSPASRAIVRRYRSISLPCSAPYILPHCLVTHGHSCGWLD